MPERSVQKSETARMRARIAELEADLASKPSIDRANLYRLTDQTPWGVLAISCDGRVDYANPAVQPWMTCPAPGTGRALEEVVAASLRDVLLPRVAAACEGEASSYDCQLTDVAGRCRHVQIGITPRSVGLKGVSGCVVQVSDLTDVKALDVSLMENEARLRLAMDAGQMAVWEFDVATGRLIAGDQLARLLGYPSGSVPSAEAIRSGYLPGDWERLSEIAQGSLARGEYAIECELRHKGPDGVQRTLLLRLEMIRDEAGEIVKGHGVLVDITQRKKAELAQQLLVNELNHRVKNTLAIVQSMARQTLRGRSDQPNAWSDFGDRLVSLAKAHDLLTAESWASADLRTLIRHATASVDGRVTATGPAVALTPKLALSLSMAIHELLTNAAKYGALSTAAGSVRLEWMVSEGNLHLTWRETGGPTVIPPTRRGFGSRLLEQALAADVNGRVALKFAASGLICEVHAPLQLQDSGLDPTGLGDRPDG